METQIVQGEIKHSGWWLSLLCKVVEAGYWTLPERELASEGKPEIAKPRKDSYYTTGRHGALILVELQSTPITLVLPSMAQ